MRKRDLIFSNRPAYRVARHLLFWMARYFLIFLYSYGTGFLSFLTSGDTWFLNNISECFTMGGFRLGVDMFYCYTVVYWLLPAYLFQKRYLRFSLLLIFFTLAIFVLNSAYNLYHYNLLNTPGVALYHTIWYHAIHFVLGGSPVVCVGFIAVKLLKTWYIEEERKTAITSANASAELRLLKAQIHPHFLFNTLNNIYSFTLSRHPRAAALADQLSGMMDYMSVEGEKEWVPLEKEIKLIQDYISLEKVRYDERLDINIEVKGDYKGKMIAPLLMIPFAENCFKHGASVVRGKQWIALDINVSDNNLDFVLSNSMPPPGSAPMQKSGIGLMNVKKRLQLIYPGQHNLAIQTNDGIYKVHLSVKLTAQPVITPSHETGIQQQSFSYA